MVKELKLHTVCESASCPNIGECWTRRALTIMILGDICTRSCRFCDVTTGRPLPVDPDEPRRVAEMLGRLGLEHTVITCVDRDDLADFGAAHWAETIRRVKAACPAMTLEILAGDFKGNTELVDIVLAADPDVFAHNLETVPRLSRQVRVQASYPRSYKILEHARQRGAVTKTGLMLGLGETRDEVEEVLRERRQASASTSSRSASTCRRASSTCRSSATPTRPSSPSSRVYARALGIPHVESGPLVRSSYHADGQAQLVRDLRRWRRVPDHGWPDQRGEPRAKASEQIDSEQIVGELRRPARPRRRSTMTRISGAPPLIARRAPITPPHELARAPSAARPATSRCPRGRTPRPPRGSTRS